MATFRYLTFFYGAVMCASTTWAALTKTPTNVAVLPSSDVTLQCATDDVDATFVRWIVNDEVVAVGSRMEGDPTKYEAEFMAGVQDLFLKVKNINSADNGTYTCDDVVDADASFSAQLLVVDDQITSSATSGSGGIVIEGNTVHYECSLGYAGRWAPTLKFYDRGVEAGHVVTSDTGEVVTSSITAAADRTMAGVQYECRAFFSTPLDPAPGAKEADNVPGYSRSATFDPIVAVHWGPEHMTLTPDDLDLIHIEEEMTCNFTSNPAPTRVQFIHTMDDGTEEVVQDGTVYLIPAAWDDGRNHTLRCEVQVDVGDGAEAEVRNMVSNSITFHVYTNFTTTTTSTTTTTTTTTTSTATTTAPAATTTASQGDPNQDGSRDSTGSTVGPVVTPVTVTMAIVTMVIAGLL